MSDTKLEFLPNEILIECFQYFNACEIFHSFDQLNDRFNHLIRHIPLCIDFANINKLIFDEFCTKMLLNSEIKNQVYSLYLPNDSRCLQAKLFWSFFTFNEFSNLQTFKSDFSLPPHYSYEKSPNVQIKLADLFFSKLRTLSISQLDSFWSNIHQTSSIINLTLSQCKLENVLYLLTYVSMLKYLHINQVNHDNELYMDMDKPVDGPCHMHLKELIIDEFCSFLPQLELLVRRTPNLKRLAVSNERCNDMMDADRWERLITSSLPNLTTFRFEFVCRFNIYEIDFLQRFKRFQTDFWQKQHHWFTEFIIGENSAFIFTIPYLKNTLKLLTYGKRYYNNLLKNNVNAFVNVTHLTPCSLRETLVENCEYYFPNITSLKLTLDFYDSYDLTSERSMTSEIEHIAYMKKIVNLSNLKHLDISDYVMEPINSYVLLEIVKSTPQLSSIKICWNRFSLFFNDNEFCKYLNQMIKTLHIELHRDFADDYFDVEHFFKVFSNIEHLEFKNFESDQLLFSLNRLPKLSTFTADWVSVENPEKTLAQFKKKIQKLNVVYDVHAKYSNVSYHFEGREFVDRRFNASICILFGKDISKRP